MRKIKVVVVVIQRANHARKNCLPRGDVMAEGSQNLLSLTNDGSLDSLSSAEIWICEFTDLR